MALDLSNLVDLLSVGPGPEGTIKARCEPAWRKDLWHFVRPRGGKAEPEGQVQLNLVKVLSFWILQKFPAGSHTNSF